MCALAHEVAAERALEDATGVVEDAGVRARREECLLAESALVQTWRTLIDWPRALGLTASGHTATDHTATDHTASDHTATDLGPLISARRLFAPVHANGHLDPDAARLLADQLSLALFPDLEVALPVMPEALIKYICSARSVGAELVRALAVAQSAAEPTGLPVLLNQEPAGWMGEQLRLQPSFGQRPTIGDDCAESGALALLAPAEQHCLWQEGPLVARGLAMLLQGSRTIEALRLAATAMARGAEPFAGGSAEPGSWGTGVAQTARGPLVCLVRVEPGTGRATEDAGNHTRVPVHVVSEVRLCAPSEWCLHPHGELARVLDELGRQGLQHFARLVAAAFDPCAEVLLDIVPGHPDGSEDDHTTGEVRSTLPRESAHA